MPPSFSWLAVHVLFESKPAKISVSRRTTGSSTARESSSYQHPEHHQQDPPFGRHLFSLGRLITTAAKLLLPFNRGRGKGDLRSSPILLLSRPWSRKFFSIPFPAIHPFWFKELEASRWCLVFSRLALLLSFPSGLSLVCCPFVPSPAQASVRGLFFLEGRASTLFYLSWVFLWRVWFLVCRTPGVEDVCYAVAIVSECLVGFRRDATLRQKTKERDRTREQTSTRLLFL